MRFDHYEGLNQSGLRLIKRRVKMQEIVKRIHPDGRVETFERKSVPAVSRVTVIGGIKGSYKTRVASLRRYHMLDGTRFDEFVQQEVWCGGPHYFIALKDMHGAVVPRTLWTDAQIKSALSDD